LAWLGIFASLIVIGICLGGLLLPSARATLNYGWAFMALAELGTGLWLIMSRSAVNPSTYTRAEPGPGLNGAKERSSNNQD
jgi:hypothetical protein